MRKERKKAEKTVSIMIGVFLGFWGSLIIPISTVIALFLGYPIRKVIAERFEQDFLSVIYFPIGLFIGSLPIAIVSLVAYSKGFSDIQGGVVIFLIYSLANPIAIILGAITYDFMKITKKMIKNKFIVI